MTLHEVIEGLEARIKDLEIKLGLVDPEPTAVVDDTPPPEPTAATVDPAAPAQATAA